MKRKTARKTDPTTRISLRVPEKLLNEADRRAEHIGASRSFVIVQSMRAYFDKGHATLKPKKRGGSNAPNPFD